MAELGVDPLTVPELGRYFSLNPKARAQLLTRSPAARADAGEPPGGGGAPQWGHLTETSPLLTPSNATLLREAWRRHGDSSKEARSARPPARRPRSNVRF